MKETNAGVKSGPLTDEAQLNEKSLGYSILDGLFASVMVGFGDSYLPAFAVYLQASAQQMGMLASLPQFAAALVQLFSVRISRLFHSPKRAVLLFVLFQACMWLFITFISYLTRSVWILILLVMLYQSFGALPGPIWFAWMGNLVPADQRGRYFGWRNRISGFFTFLSVVSAGLMLHQVSKTQPLAAFGLLFLVAFGARMVSLYFLVRQHEPPTPRTHKIVVRLSDFLKSLRSDNFGMFALFSALMNFAVFIASPLMSLYWLRFLHFSYLQYMSVVSTASIASFITMTFWGQHADHYGNKTILEASGVIIAGLPLLWYFLRFLSPVYHFPLSIMIQAMAGFSWAGFNLSSSNFIYDTIRPSNRTQMVAYFNFLKGIAIFLGGLLGGTLASTGTAATPIAFLAPKGIMLVLLLSTAGRFCVLLLFLPRILEVRASIKPRPHFLYFVTVMPFKGLVYELVTGVNRTLNRSRKKIKN